MSIIKLLASRLLFINMSFWSDYGRNWFAGGIFVWVVLWCSLGDIFRTNRIGNVTSKCRWQSICEEEDDDDGIRWVGRSSGWSQASQQHKCLECGGLVATVVAHLSELADGLGGHENGLPVVERYCGRVACCWLVVGWLGWVWAVLGQAWQTLTGDVAIPVKDIGWQLLRRDFLHNKVVKSYCNHDFLSCYYDMSTAMSVPI